MLSNLLHTSHNTEAEIENTLEELRYFIFKNSMMGSSQVVIYLKRVIFQAWTHPLRLLEVSPEDMESFTRGLLRIGQLL